MTNSNKQIAESFLKMAGFGNTKEAYDKFVALEFKHHNQYFKGDRQSLMEAMLEAHKTNPNKAIDIKYIYADGNTVITHSHVVRQNSNEADVAVVHIFRFENQKIVELWDLGQLISKDSPNENGPF